MPTDGSAVMVARMLTPVENSANTCAGTGFGEALSETSPTLMSRTLNNVLSRKFAGPSTRRSGRISR